MANKGIKKVDRAAQFLPFNSLRGYYDKIREQERIKEDKKILSNEVVMQIEDKLKQIKKGMMVKVKYYDKDAYVIKEGLVSNIDFIYNTITIVLEVINFKDILDIYSDNISTNDF